jgi:hypothetical protein
MDRSQIESHIRSNQLYNKILLKLHEQTLQQPPSYLLFPHPNNEIPNPDKIAVIVDPRYDELMEAVIMNFMHFMVPEGWLFMIGTAGQYKEKVLKRFPQSIFLNIDTSLLYYDENKNPNLTIDNYNAIFCSKDLWNKIPCENIAIFQKDCVMYRMFSEEWPLKYAYSGAYYYTEETSLKNGVINGGFSLRKKSAMLDCIKHVTWEMIEVYRKNIYSCHEYLPVKKCNEDVFFTYACEILQYPIAPISIRKQLAIESEYYQGTSVFHGWNKVGYQNEEWAKKILSLSPLFSKILPEVLNTPSSTNTETSSKKEEEQITQEVFHLPEKSEPEITL